MADVDVSVWLASGYAVFLLLVGFALDVGARHASTRTTAGRAGAFRYHEQHDAWVCAEDQWLWPMSFDPDNRVMRYRASPAVCAACPNRCTTSASGREVTRNVDPWPGSEVERFHRTIACSVAVLGILWPLATMIGQRTPAEHLVLLTATLTVSAGSWPLWSHLHRTPAKFPEHIRVETLDQTLEAQATALAAAAEGRSGYRSDGRGRSAPVSVSIATRRGLPSPHPSDQPTGVERSAFASRWSELERHEGNSVPDRGRAATRPCRTEEE